MPNLIAVFALPVGSHTMPNRGLRSFQFGTSVRAGNERAGTSRPAGTSVAFTDSRSQSNRTPAVIVTRLMRHWSWTKRPRSGLSWSTV